MASKSRLGKGLGALFPALPGEAEKATPSTSSKSKPITPKATASSSKNVSRETLASKRKPDDASSKSSDDNRYKNVSRETSKKVASATIKDSKQTPKVVSVKNKAQKKDAAQKKDVSRETSPKESRRRLTMPSLKEGMAHPSDLFFGSTVEDEKSSDGTGLKNSSKLSADISGNSGNSVEPSVKKNVEESEPKRFGADALKPVEGGYLVELDLDKIGPNANQPRTIFDEDELKELAASLKEVGVLQPVVVRKRPANQKAVHRVEATDTGVVSKHAQQNMDSEYELIMGERRWRAAHLAGLKSIPAIVKTTSDNQMLRDALLENLHRVALNPLEESAAYQQMMEDFGLTQEQLSKSVSKSRSQIANTLRLLNLPPSVQKKVAAGVLSAGHARALLGLPNEEEMEKLANRIIAEGLSVRSTEEIVAMKTNGTDGGKKQKAKKNNPWEQSPIQHTLENRFDTKVAIKGSKQHGRIEIVFSSPEDMDRIVNLLVPEQENKKQNGWV
ncbi:ParB/RepB/Spo0J family partition protein [Bifidobacterium sp. ESL0745]|uniref:ParB/RepB/Spo0J family partition protein n=1 Tax=Bifidobacterium sp. ESL0745 TaxID=2983226 RepID=UPI0023FA2055|nr:ParB/RepB/Spo0J family partition protein [Bifidobacterium sp. ESL0745]MDF7665950.1 ParB/RepB/Spo0J family partition protein [Bifidobacterium sp. ESL0745]